MMIYSPPSKEARGGVSSEYLELAALSIYIDQCLGSDEDVSKLLPIDAENLFSKCSDGLVFCKLINLTVSGMIREKDIKKKDNMHVAFKIENMTLAFQAAKEIGCEVHNIRPKDMIDGHPKLVRSFLLQIIRKKLTSTYSSNDSLADPLFEEISKNWNPSRPKPQYLIDFEEEKADIKRKRIEEAECRRMEAEDRAERERINEKKRIEAAAAAAVEAERKRREAKERAERERIEAKERAERERIEAEEKAERKRREAKERAEREKREEEEKAERKRREAKERAERKRIEAEEKAVRKRIEEKKRIEAAAASEAERKRIEEKKRIEAAAAAVAEAERKRREEEERAERERIEVGKRAERERIEAEEKAERKRIEAEERAEREMINEKNRIEAAAAEAERKRREEEEIAERERIEEKKRVEAAAEAAAEAERKRREEEERAERVSRLENEKRAAETAEAVASVDIFPVAPNLFIDISVRMEAGAADVWVATVPSSKNLSFLKVLQVKQNALGSSDKTTEELLMDCIFVCKPFCILNMNDLKKEDLCNGAYSSNELFQGSKLHNVLQLKGGEFIVHFKNKKVIKLDDFYTSGGGAGGQSGSLSTQLNRSGIPFFVDIGAAAFAIEFIYEDLPVEYADFVGFYSTKFGGGLKVKISGKTNEQGRIVWAFPGDEGSIEGQVSFNRELESKESQHTASVYRHMYQPVLNKDSLTSSENMLTLQMLTIDLQKRSELFKSPNDAPSELSKVNVISNSKVVASISASHDNRCPLVVLGDTSGSMYASDGRLECLKATMASLLISAIKLKTQIAFMQFDTKGYAFKPTYLTIEDQLEVNAWVSRLDPDGGTCLKQSIEDAIKIFPDARDIHVVCDGDVGVFEYSWDLKNENNWTIFRNKYEKVRFHFVALSRDANYKTMAKMSQIGGGNFTIANHYENGPTSPDPDPDVDPNSLRKKIGSNSFSNDPKLLRAPVVSANSSQSESKCCCCIS